MAAKWVEMKAVVTAGEKVAVTVVPMVAALAESKAVKSGMLTADVLVASRVARREFLWAAPKVGLTAC